MQSSNLAAARAMRDAFATPAERDAFAAGYDHAHGIACHNVPRVGETVSVPHMGRVTVSDAEHAAEIHAELCFDAEMNARCYSPWEFTAAEINGLPAFEAEAAWEAYEAGVAAAIEHDLAGYGPDQYGAEIEGADA